MHPELLYQYNENQRQDRLEEARLIRLGRAAAAAQNPVAHPALLNVANRMISAGQRLQSFAMGRPSYHNHNTSPLSGD